MSKQTAETLLSLLTSWRERLLSLPEGDTAAAPEEDIMMLSLMVTEAMAGVDLSHRYPAFYHRMQTNDQLRTLFLESLEMMVQTQTSTLATLPGEPSRDLSFLHKAKAKPVIRQASANQWQLLWRKTALQLQHAFSSMQMQTRDAHDFYDEVWAPLLQDRVVLPPDVTVQVVLEAMPDEEDEALVRPLLQVAVENNAEAMMPLLQATLQWGDYVGQVVVDERGRGAFPPVPLLTVYDVEEEQFIAEIQFKVETINPANPLAA